MIFLDTNVISEPLRPQPDAHVMHWLSTLKETPHIAAVALGEIAFGVWRLKPDPKAKRLLGFLAETQERFANCIHPYDDASALIYGEIMGRAHRNGHNASVPDGMIAAITLRHGGVLATRNVKDFKALGVDVINPWTA